MDKQRISQPPGEVQHGEESASSPDAPSATRGNGGAAPPVTAELRDAASGPLARGPNLRI